MTADQLSKIYPLATAARIAEFIEPINQTFTVFGINTLLRQAAFLGQIGHESGQLKYTKEIWGPTDAQLRYEGRTDLGNTERGDGKRFMGRGLIQVTGRANYKKIGDLLNVDLIDEPELLERPDLAARSAGIYWRMKACNIPADMGDIERLTKIINGGLNGLEDRRALYTRALSVLGS